MNVRKVLEAKGSTHVFTVSASASLREFVEKAWGNRVGALVVIDEQGQLAGIVSERDVLRHCYLKSDFEKTRLGDIMTTDVVCVGAEDDINRAMDLMVEKRIRHLPVVEGATIVGIITVRDVIYALRKADKDDMRQFVEYLRRKACERSST